MKKLFSAVAAVSMMTNAAVAAEVESKAGAKIVAPLQVSNVSALYFGTVAPSLTADDKVVVSPAGAKTCGAELTCLSDDHTAAKFEVTGQAEASYTIDLPSTIRIANGNGESMTVTDFQGSKTSGKLSSGADDFTVGGTLAVAANQAAGDYTGTFTVAVEYK